MDVAQLQVAVSSTGIKETSQALSGLGTSADNAAAKVDKLTTNVEKLISKNLDLSSVTAKATQLLSDQGTSFKNLITATQQIAKSMTDVVFASQKLIDALTTLNGAQAQSIAGFSQSSKWGNVFTSTLKAMATATAAYALHELAKSVVEAGDEWTMLSARLQVATGSMQGAKAAQADLYDISQRLRVPINELGTLYARLIPPMDAAGKSAKETRDQLEFVSMAIKLNGNSTSEAASVILEYSHAMSQGVMNGREFNALSMRAPIILKALKDELENTANSGFKAGESLKEFVSKGGVTFDIMQAAAERALPAIRDQFEKLPVTVADAMTRLKNAFEKSFGEANNTSQLNAQLVKFIGMLQDSLPKIAENLSNVLAIVAENIKLIITLVATLAAGALAKWAIESIAALKLLAAEANLTAAGVTLTGAAVKAAAEGLTLMSGAAGLARAAMAALGGPIGLLVMAIGGAVAAWEMYGKSAEDANDKAAKTTDDSTQKLIRDLQLQLDKYNELLKARALLGAPLANSGDALQQGINKATVEMIDAKQKLEDFKRIADASNQSDIDHLNQLGAAAEKAEKDLQTLKMLVDKTQPARDEKQSALLAEKQDTLKSQFMTQFADHTQKATEAIEEWRKKFEDAHMEFTKADEQMVRNKFHLDAPDDSRSKNYLKSLEQANKEIEKQNQEINEQAEGIESGPIAKALQQYADLQKEIAKNNDLIAQGYAVVEDGTGEHLVKLNNDMVKALQAQNKELKIQADLRMQEGFDKQDKQDQSAVLENAKSDLKQLDEYLDTGRVEKFGKSMKEAFGGIGEAIGKAVDAFDAFNKREIASAKAIQQAQNSKNAGLITEQQYLNDVSQIQEKRTESQLQANADILDSMKNLFGEHTAIYKAMDAAEKMYRAEQVAMAIKNTAVELGLIDATTAARLMGYAEAAASSIESTAVQIANALGLGQVLAVLGVINQAQGDPYSAFGRMAVMAGVMAALGFAVYKGAGLGAHSQAAPTYNTGTGTVLGGSSTDTSKSLENSISDLQSIDKMTMQYSAQMAASLQNIENELGGVANLVFQGGTLNTGNNLGINVGTSKNMGDPIASKLGLGGLATIGWNDVPVFGQFITALQGLWGKTTQEISAAGVAINGTVQQLMNGVGMSQFADVKTTSSSFFGLSKSTSYNTQTAALDPEMQQQFSLIFSSMASEIGQAAQALGQPLDSIQNRLNSFVLNLGKIDLKGLTGKDLQDRLAAVFGAAGDSMAKAALPGFEAFQKVGEGYLETVTRVASGFEQAKVALSGLGVAMVDLNSIVNKQGDVGGELVRQSIEVKEAGTGVGAIMDTLSGSASDLVAAYKQLVDLRNQMSAVNLGTNLTSDLIAAAGGVQSMSSALKAYSDNFFTDSERQAAAVKQLSTQFSALGLQMPSTKEAFRALVDQLEGQGNATLAMQVIGLADAFSQVADASTSVQAVTDAQSALNDAYNSQKQSLTNLKTTFDDFAKSIGDFRNSLMTGNLSPLSPEEKYATISAQYASVSQAALSGDQDAISEYQSVAEQFLQASQQYNASGDQYVQDYQKVLDQSQAILEESQGQSSVAQQQLDALDQQVNGLIQINTSVLTVTQAIENLQAAMTANAVVAPITTGSNPGVNAPTAGTNSVAPIVNSVNALSAQVETLTQATVQNGQAIVSATYDSNAQNAQTIVSATNDAAGRGTYNSRVVVPLA